MHDHLSVAYFKLWADLLEQTYDLNLKNMKKSEKAIIRFKLNFFKHKIQVTGLIVIGFYIFFIRQSKILLKHKTLK